MSTEEKPVVVEKMWYWSKTVWVAIVTAIAGIAQAIHGEPIIDVELQLFILAGLGTLVRIWTKGAVVWKKPTKDDLFPKASVTLVLLLFVVASLTACAGTGGLRRAEIAVESSYNVFTAVEEFAAREYDEGRMSEEDWLEFVEFSKKVVIAHDAFRTATELAQKIEKEEGTFDYFAQLQASELELIAAVNAAYVFLTDVGVLGGDD